MKSTHASLAALSVAFMFSHSSSHSQPQRGSVDLTFDPGPGPVSASWIRYPISTVAVQDDGKILIGGSFTNFGGQPYRGIARLNPNGSVDASFDPGSRAANQNKTIVRLGRPELTFCLRI
jgi:hypothetical protein